MSEQEIGSTLQITRKLVGRLPKELDDQLKSLIRRAEDGQDLVGTENAIADLLSPHENIRLWVLEQINLQGGQRGTTRGFGSLPGWQGSVQASKKWICPNESCSESLPVIQSDEDPPTCAVHERTMVLAD